MIYQSSSVEETIGRIIRNTRVQDTAFIADMPEWIAEAMEMMHTKHQYSPDFEDITIKFHKGCLPCGLAWIDAVEYCGHRLRYGNSVKNIKTKQTEITTPNPIPTFISVPYKDKLPDGNALYTSTAFDALKLTCHPDHYYQTEMRHILTSFADGCVRVHFNKIPVDDNGFPLIPDNMNYKEAIYWYVRAKMIGAGFSDKEFTYDKCWQFFDQVYAPRAVAEIDYPSPDQMEDRIRKMTTLVLPEFYFEQFNR